MSKNHRLRGVFSRSSAFYLDICEGHSSRSPGRAAECQQAFTLTLMPQEGRRWFDFLAFQWLSI